jgi:hypothetical protein
MSHDALEPMSEGEKAARKLDVAKAAKFAKRRAAAKKAAETRRKSSRPPPRKNS